MPIAILGQGDTPRTLKTERVADIAEAMALAVDGWTLDGFGAEDDRVTVPLGHLHDLSETRAGGVSHEARNANASNVVDAALAHMA